MARTMVNVGGDLVAAAVVDSTEEKTEV
jgi:Na+/H+-dicarboxylate symporter